MNISKLLATIIISVSFATSGFAADYKKDRAETLNYNLTESLNKGIEGSGDDVKELTNLLFRQIGRDCQLDASVGRCGCTLDGIRVSCRTVLAFLRAGFAVAVD